MFIVNKYNILFTRGPASLLQEGEINRSVRSASAVLFRKYLKTCKKMAIKYFDFVMQL